MLKEQLLKEAQALEVSVELDSIFESANLSEETKQTFTTVFEQAVKTKAIELAESHIGTIAESAETKVADLVEAQVKEVELRLVESADKLFEHVAAQWLAENQVAVHKGIKADLFESMFEGLKTLVVEHNVVLPEESVDIVAEMEDELHEAKEQAGTLLASLNESRDELKGLKRTTMVEKATADLTESQKEKVGALIEGLEFSDVFETKLGAIVEMAKGSKSEKAATLNEATEAGINTITEDAAGLNFKVEPIAESTAVEPAKPTGPINQYIAAAKRI